MKKWNSPYLACRPFEKAAAPLPRQAGFTIVELMMSLVLLAIGAALSLPSYREMVEKRQLTHGAEQIMAFVNSAQGEAMKQNQVVTVSYARTADNDWCFGAVIGAAACDCTEALDSETDFCAIDSAPRVINNENTGNTRLVKAITGDGAYSFDPIRGIFIDLDDSLAVQMSSNDESYQLNLSVSITGQVMLCSSDANHRVPGYGVCLAEVVDEES
ncbi:MAG TPA: GspH/FimT family pseudopilin [Xanthomonadales bacterium]|nr:GspH/FimT family pseudopilin [Xanthomonadales bacterium]